MQKAQLGLALIVAASAGATAGRFFPPRSKWQGYSAAKTALCHAVKPGYSNPETEGPAEAATATAAPEEATEAAPSDSPAGQEGADARALAEAKRLGLLDEVSREQPDLTDREVRRIGVALVKEAHRHHMDPLLLAAVARVESHFDPFAKSDKGALGVMQIRLPTGQELAARSGLKLKRDVELYDIETNVALGARYLARLRSETPSWEAALVAYNHGPAAARRLLDGPEAKDALDGYPRLVLAARDELAEAARDRSGG